jgi:dTDP-4-dehydrorhamnose reductase
MILLLGGTGYVGQAFARHLHQLGVPVQKVSAKMLLTGGKEVLRAKLREIRPAFLINAAGFTGKPNVDACERMKAETLEGNLVFPLMLGEVCAAEGIPWGHVSSGCIYQGQRGVGAEGDALGFREEDEPNFDFHHPPCSFYSGTKALAERLLADFPALYIWRLRVPFDEADGPRNYLSKLMRYPRLLDVRNSLSHRGDFVSACWESYTRHLPYGIYNLTNHGSVTTREVVRMIEEEGQRRVLRGEADSSQPMNKHFDFFASEEEFMQKAALAPRSSCVLDTEKAKRAQLPLRDIHVALAEALQHWTWESTP